MELSSRKVFISITMAFCLQVFFFFSVGVIASNIITAILISTRALGGLSADLYSFDCKYISSFYYLYLLNYLGVITTYFLIRQFKSTKPQDELNKQMDEDEDTGYDIDDEDKPSINLSSFEPETVNGQPAAQHIVPKKIC
jgi:hypothetical protein